jgi:heat-inducible transcriptional repressor
VRNDVARLEKRATSCAHHTPPAPSQSDRGYRYYVSTLNRPQLPVEEQFLINHLFHQVEDKLEEWLNLRGHLLAQQTHNVAVVTAPRPTPPASSTWNWSRSSPAGVAVLVLQGAKVRQQLLSFDEVISQEELSRLSSRLNKTPDRPQHHQGARR